MRYLTLLFLICCGNAETESAADVCNIDELDTYVKASTICEKKERTVTHTNGIVVASCHRSCS